MFKKYQQLLRNSVESLLLIIIQSTFQRINSFSSSNYLIHHWTANGETGNVRDSRTVYVERAGDRTHPLKMLSVHVLTKNCLISRWCETG